MPTENFQVSFCKACEQNHTLVIRFRRIIGLHVGIEEPTTAVVEYTCPIRKVTTTYTMDFGGAVEVEHATVLPAS